MRTLTSATSSSILAALLFAMALSSAGCEINRTPRPAVFDPDSAARVEVRATMDEFQEALLAGDARGVAAFFTSESRLQRTDSPDLVGAGAVHDAYRELFAAVSVTELSLDRSVIDVVRGGAVWESGTFRETLRAPDATVQMTQGRYAIRWRRGPESTWRIDMFLQTRYPADDAADTAADGAADTAAAR